MAITLPRLDDSVEREIIAAIISANLHGFSLTVTETRSVCPVCGGGDPFCSTCGGSPTFDTAVSIGISGLSRWKTGENRLYSPNGQNVDGDLVGVFSVDACPSGYASFDEVLRRTTAVTAHNRVWVVDRWWYRGAPSNRVYVALKEDEAQYGERM